MVGLDRLIGGFEFVDWLEVALFDGGLIWFWFNGGGVALGCWLR